MERTQKNLYLSFLMLAMIKQFISDISWGKIDYLLIDTPPGISLY